MTSASVYVSFIFFGYLVVKRLQPNVTRKYLHVIGVKVLFQSDYSCFFRFLVVSKRDDTRRTEAIVKAVLAPVIYLFPTLMSVPVETVARAMVNDAVKQASPSGLDIYDNKQIHKLAKESD